MNERSFLAARVSYLKGLQTASSIRKEAERLFAARGYAAVSMRDIAEAVGIRQASMYHYFGTKDDILATLLETTVVASLDRARVLLDGDGPALARLLELARFDVDQLAQIRIGALGHDDAGIPTLGGDDEVREEQHQHAQ